MRCAGPLHRLCLLLLALALPIAAQIAPTSPKNPAAQNCPCEHSTSGGATAFVMQPAASSPQQDSPTRLKDLVPLLQSMVWALLIAAAVFGLRKELFALLRDRHVKLEAAGVSLEILPEEQVTDPMELDIWTR